MTQITSNNAGQIMGLTATDEHGDKIGKVEQVYLNDQTNAPEWVTISTGLFGKKESFAPLRNANFTDDKITLAVSKDAVKDAPQITDDGHLDETEQAELYRYYAAQLSGNTQYADRVTDDKTGNAGTTDEAITRSEERMHVGTERVETGRARLVKYIVTENVTKTIPVSHEEVRLEREIITDANRGEALTGSDISEAEYEVTLHAERPVVSTETVPVERVKLSTETVTDTQEVAGTVRKEQVEMREDGDTYKR
jgi:uncharacterized protein (TIGR02271 family)